jgi:hypothetical protein
VNNRPIPPCRCRSTSSMGSAPTTIRVTSAGIFRCAFAPGSEELPFVLGVAADAVEMVLIRGLTAAQRSFTRLPEQMSVSRPRAARRAPGA